MTRHDDPTQPLEQLAADVADGVRSELSKENDVEPTQASLLKLQRLSEAFGAAREGWAANGGAPEFHWCHLDVFEALGRGGFGTVYRAFDGMLGREVALKLRSGSNARDQALLREARRLARVRHPNVLAIHGADVDDGRAGIWTDLLHGQTLEQALEAGITFDPAQVLALAQPLADALRVIHAAGLIHGDIKASNVMLQRDGAPILMDFGAASDSSDEAQTTGSPLVMAPEALAGDEPDPSADIYSLGALFYRISTGRHLLEADSVEQLRASHLREQAMDFAPVAPILRPLLEPMLRFDPARRPDARELLIHLGRISDRPARRRRLLATTTVIVALALAASALSFGLIRAQQAERRALAAQGDSEYALQFLQNILSSPKGSESGVQARVVDVVAQAVREYEFSPPVDPHRRARIAQTLGQTYLALDDLDMAGKLLDQAEAALLAAKPTDWPTLLRLRISQAELLMNRSEMALANELLKVTEGDLAREAPGETQTHLHLLLTWSDQQVLAGNQTTARELLEKANGLAARLERRTDYPARIQAALAELNRPSDLALSERQARSARAWLKDLGEKNSEQVINVNHILVATLIEAGKFDQAHPIMDETLELARRQYPSGSGVEVLLLNLESVLLDRTGHAQAALQTNEKSLALARELWGNSHRNTLTTSANQGVRLQSLGRIEDAIAAYRQTLAGLRESYSDTDPMALLVRGNLAEALLLSGQYREAEEIATEALADDLVVFGPNHALSLFVTDILGAAQFRQGKVAAAREILEQSWQAKRETMGDANPYTHDAAVLLAEVLMAQGETERAIELFSGALENRRKTLGAEHTTVVDVEKLLSKARQLTEEQAL